MNTLCAKLALLIVWAPALASSPDCIAERAAVISGLEFLAGAMQAGDPTAAIGLTHPKLVQLAGGDASYTALVKRTLADLKSKGLALGTTTFGTPTMTYRAGPQYVCFVPSEMTLTIQQARVKAIGFFAAAHDGTARSTWKYVDGAGFVANPELVQRIFPSLPSGIEFPPTRNERLQ